MQETLSSLEINRVENTNIFETNNLNIIDFPGQGFYREKIKENLKRSLMIIVFVDSVDK